MATWRKVIVSGSDAELNTVQVGGGSGGSGTTLSTAGAITADAAVTAGTSFIIGSADINETDLEKLDGISNGTAAANKAVVLDGSKNIATIGTIGCGAITATGTSTFGAAASPDAVGGADLGSTGAEWGDIYIADDKSIKFGNDQDVTIEYDENGTDELRFAGNAVTFEQAVTFDGAVTLGNATGDSITVLGNSTFSGTTIANLGTVSAATSITATDLIGTNIDGILGADTARAITGTTITANTSVLPDSSGGADLGSTSAEWGDIYIGDDKKIQFGAGQDATIEYDEDGTDELRFAGAAVTFEQAVTFDGAVTLGNATGDSITISGNSTFSGTTIANLGTVSAATSITSTAFVGPIDGIIGGNTPAAITGTTITANTSILPDAAGGADIGSTSAEWGDVYIADDKKIKFGDGQDATIEYDEDGTDELRFAGAAVTFEQAVTFDGTVSLGESSGDTITVLGNSTFAGTTIANLGTVSAATSVTSTAFVGPIDGIVGGNTPAAGSFTSLTTSGNATIAGDLTVNGTTTTLATANLAVGDQFIFAATGSAGTNVDAGLIVQSGSAVDSGSAIYHDINSERWAVATGIGSIAQAVTPKQMVVTTTLSTSTPGSSDGDYGVGEMWLETDSQDIWIRTA